MVVLQRRIGREGVDEFEAGGGAVGHGDGDGAIEFDDGGCREMRKLFVEAGDARPIRFFGGASASVAGGNGGLQSVRSGCGVRFFREVESGESAANEELIPKAAVLIEKENGLALCAGARGET